MKRILTFILSAMLLFSLTACGSKMYEVTTKGGDTFISKGAPNYDVKSESYKFKNDQGKEVILNKEDIDSIQEK